MDSDVGLLKSMYDKLAELKKELEVAKAELSKVPDEHDTVKKYSEKRVLDLEEKISKVNNDINTFVTVKSNDTKSKREKYISDLNRKYSNQSTNTAGAYATMPEEEYQFKQAPIVEIEEKKEVVKINDKPKVKASSIKDKANKYIAELLIAAIGLPLAVTVETKRTAETINASFEIKPEEEIIQTIQEDNIPKLKDASDNKQVMKRAMYLVSTFPDTYGQIELDDLIFLIETANGAYNDSNNETAENTILDAANILINAINRGSPKNNVINMPISYIFEDGSPAQISQAVLDGYMSDMVSAINNNDKESFMYAAQRWGETVRDITIFISYSQEDALANVLANSTTGYFEYLGITGKYTSILEYMKNNNIDVAIDIAKNIETGNIVKTSLSELINRVNDEIYDSTFRSSVNKTASQMGIAK